MPVIWYLFAYMCDYIRGYIYIDLYFHNSIFLVDFHNFIIMYPYSIYAIHVIPINFWNVIFSFFSIIIIP